MTDEPIPTSEELDEPLLRKPVVIDPALLAELAEVSGDPEQIIDTAIRQWLHRRATKEADRSRPLAMNPVVPPRGEWND
ncbi:MAG: hypothetical protein HC919_15415 [Oscillatoriales cyanobacterium SM2_2_1]|nr:hypothetical protein [Oscillatoriales cyanobacterium SM2_2_1]